MTLHLLARGQARQNCGDGTKGVDETGPGIPGAKILMNGDIINIDVTVIKNGYHGDTSRMYFVGERKRIDTHPSDKSESKLRPI